MADEQRLLVRAKPGQMVFYGGNRIRPGQTFSVLQSEFSEKSMELADPGARDDLEAARLASPKQRGPGGVALKQQPAAKPTGGRRGLEPDRGI